jgi:tripartite-type tricarboxylate transporter receptor subunit TctC
MNRIILAFAAVAATVVPALATAQDWPTQPVKIVVPYPPGTPVDALGRALGERLQAKWKQPVIIENKTGASEVIAATAVAQAKPDGYTLLFATEVGLGSNYYLFSKLSYNPITDFTPITLLAEGPAVLVVRSDSKYKTMQELVAGAKKNPESVSYGSPGTGGSIHLFVTWMSKQAGMELKHVPYRGSTLAVQDTLGGVIDFSMSGATSAMPFIESGRLRPLAVSGARRIKSMPDVPTVQEAGIPDSVYEFMFGLVGPAKLPAAIANKIAADVTEILKDPAFQAKNTEPFGYTAGGGTPAEFARVLDAERERQKARVQAAGVKLD